MGENPGEDIEYMTFRRLLFMNRNPFRHLLCGSFFELPIRYFIANPTDIDILFHLKYVSALSANRDHVKSARLNKTIFLIDTESSHIGFARLRKSAQPSSSSSAPASASSSSSPSSPSTSSSSSSSAKQTDTEFYCKPKHWKRYVRDVGPSHCQTANILRYYQNDADNVLLRLFNTVWTNKELFKIDYVYAIYCPYWPDEASEWKTRKRENGWPTDDVIDKIVQTGCHLVSKPHQSNPEDETQWRFSFSQAEVILINHWTQVQRHIYHVLRVIKGEIVKACGGEHKTVLCTYFFKTLMLWACEEKPQDFWREENTETAVGELLCIMIEWLIERRCPNYFVPDNNMIDYLNNDDNLSKEISLICKYRMQHLQTFLINVRPVFNESPLLFRVPGLMIEYLSSLLIRRIYLRSHGEHLSNLLSKSEGYLPQIRLLFNGIKSQKRLSNGLRRDVVSRDVEMCDVDRAAKYFRLLTEGNFPCSLPSEFLIYSDCSNVELFRNLIRFMQENCNYQSKIDSQSNINVDRPTVSKDRLSATGIERVVNDTMKCFARKWKSPMYLVSIAYYANYLYTVLKDCCSTLDQCRIAFSYVKDFDSGAIKIDIGLQRGSLSMLLTNDWSAIFDDHVQTVLGFLTLCSAIRTQQHRDVVVDICPHVFLKYLYFQSVRKLGMYEPVRFNWDLKWLPSQQIFGWFSISSLSKALLMSAIAASGILPIKTDGHLTAYYVSDSKTELMERRLS